MLCNVVSCFGETLTSFTNLYEVSKQSCSKDDFVIALEMVRFKAWLKQ